MFVFDKYIFTVILNESQTRIISCTNKINLVLEKQVVRWRMKYVGKKLDPDQFGRSID